MPMENQNRASSVGGASSNSGRNRISGTSQHDESKPSSYTTSTRDGLRRNTTINAANPLNDRYSYNRSTSATNNVDVGRPRLSPDRIWEMDCKRGDSGPVISLPVVNIPPLSASYESLDDDAMVARRNITTPNPFSNNPLSAIPMAPLSIPDAPFLSLPSVSSGPSTGKFLATSHPVPSYKPRARRIATKETYPDDISGLVELGMAPFMPGQDAIANQNRLVRNESIMAQHFLRFKHRATRSDEARAQTEQDIYRLLAEHKAAINSLSSASPATCTASLRNDPEFLALLDAHTETRKMLDKLLSQLAGSSRSLNSNRGSVSPSHPTSASGHPAPLLLSSTTLSQPRAVESENSRKRKHRSPSPVSVYRPSPFLSRLARTPTPDISNDTPEPTDVRQA